MTWVLDLLKLLFGSSSNAALLTVARDVVAEATTALINNIAAVGVEDGARFIADARALSVQINAKTDATGIQKMELYLSAAKELIVELGGDVGHVLAESVTRTLAELFHQTDANLPRG
jgi:hypothetical protein